MRRDSNPRRPAWESDCRLKIPKVKSRKELLAGIKRQHWKYLRADNGDLPEGWNAVSDAAQEPALLRVLGG